MKKIFLFGLLLITSMTLIGCDFLGGEISTEYELVGAAQMTLEVGDTYNELGTTYTPEDDVVITGSVDTSTIGIYTIEYEIPLQNNASLTLTRFVEVVDTTIPVITLIGTDMEIELGTTFTDPGATALDNYDGDISTDIVASGVVDVSTAGTYTIEYDVSDSSGNAAITVSRIVIVTNIPSNEPPVITLIGANPLILVQGDTFTDPGATALDTEDGDITGDINVTGSVDTNIPDVYQITYTVTDSNNNTVTETRMVEVQANEAPELNILYPNPTVMLGDTYVEGGAEAQDQEDGDISHLVVITGSVDTNTVGSYVITYSVTDSGGATTTMTSTVTVIMIVNLPPEIELMIINPGLAVGDTYNEEGAMANDSEDGDISHLIVITGTVDTTNAGVYTITYCVTDSGGVTTCVNNYVSVIQPGDQEPILDLVGSSQITHVIGDTYVELGATAMDPEDGDISAQIVIDDSMVDWSTEGYYTIEYSVVDSGGHYIQTARSIHVIPMGYDYPPVITLLGNQHMIIPFGSTFTDPGATAMDQEDGDITANIIVIGTVDTNTEGYYEIVYQITDSFGNQVEEVRTVEVGQNEAPNLNVINLNPVLVMGDMYIEQGATAEDFEDGDITASVVITGTVNTFMMGQYPITYSVTDSGGATTTIVSIVTVTGPNNTAPVLTLLGLQHVVLVVGDIYTEAGATAMDGEEGDISAQIVIDDSQVDWNNEGVYQISYYIQDMGFLSDIAYREIEILPVGADLPPTITLIGLQNLSVILNGSFTDQGATALDPEDGDITASIIVNGSVDTTVVGLYTINYEVTDSQGHTVSVERYVEVKQDYAPIIDPNDWFPVYYVGDMYFEWGATAWDDEDGDLTAQIITSGTVDTSVAGQYIITYQVTDSGGNTVTFDNIVSVTTIGNTAPVITLIGLQDIQLVIGTPYNELGATAQDDEDGDITSSIVIDDSQVDWNTPGFYVISYTVTDSGYLFTEEFRYITLSGSGTNLHPVLTLVGPDEIYLTVGDTYTEQGATAIDPEDGDISVNIIIDSSALDMNVAGYYNISYFVQDSAGNEVQIWRLIVVESVGYDAPPTITLIGSSYIYLSQGDTYTEQGANALDAEDGDITSSIIISGIIDTSVPGTQIVTYEVTDSGGNTIWVYRHVVVSANQCPSLSYIEILPYITLGDTYVYPGMTAYDFEDGNITANIVISGSYDTTVLGNYIMWHTITDSQGCSTTLPNIISVINTTSNPPVLDLIGGGMQLHVGDTYVEYGATAIDAEDGDLSDDIIIVDTYVDWTTPGMYRIYYFVFDSDHHFGYQIRFVEVLETGVDAVPFLALNNDCFVRVAVGEKFIDPGYSAWDSEDGDLTSSVIVTGTVDTNVIGSYYLTYEVTDSFGHTVYEYLTVFVE